MMSSADVRRVTGLPVIARIPWTQTFPRLAARDTTPGAVAVANLRAIGLGVLPPVLLLAPAGRHEARPLVRYLIARAIAASGRRVAVVETDAAGALPTDINIPEGTPGFRELLAGSADIDAATVRAADRLDVVPAGDTSSILPAPVLERGVERALLQVASRHDVIVLEATAGGGPLDLQTVGPVAKAAVLVLSHAFTTERSALRVLAHLRMLGVLPIGVLLIDAPALGSPDLAETWRDDDYLRITEPTGFAAAAAEEPARIRRPRRAVTGTNALAGADASARATGRESARVDG